MRHILVLNHKEGHEDEGSETQISRVKWYREKLPLSPDLPTHHINMALLFYEKFFKIFDITHSPKYSTIIPFNYKLCAQCQKLVNTLSAKYD
jgi:hypothetical protein